MIRLTTYLLTTTTALLLFAVSPALGQNRYVTTTGSNTSDCSSETNPCATITYAIDQASSGDTIQIADGAYTESFEIDRSLSLQGESEENTIIQAHEEPQQATERVITIDGEFDIEIATLTIRHGVATIADLDGHGGGIYNNDATVRLVQVTFSENWAEGRGGGMFNSGDSSELTNVAFVLNNASSGAGGMANDDSSPILNDVLFSENSAVQNAGGMGNGNGSSPSLTNVIFSENNAGTGGGGIGNDDSSPILKNVLFIDNTAPLAGGGMANVNGSSPILTNVAFIGNIASAFGGGGMYNESGSSPTLTNVTFSGNTSVQGGGVFNVQASLTLTNTIVWGNTASGEGNEIYNDAGGETTLNYSLYSNDSGDIEGPGDFEAENSLTDAPLFVDAENGDLRLFEDSPAIDAGDPDTDSLIFPTDAEGNPIDLDGNLRFFGDEIDMGAYENQGTVADEASPEEIADGLSLPSPNPASGTSTFTVAVESGQDVTVEVFDVTGRRVQTLYEGALATGMSETLTLDASALPAGIYVVRAAGEDFTKTRQVTIVR